MWLVNSGGVDLLCELHDYKDNKDLAVFCYCHSMTCLHTVNTKLVQSEYSEV